MKFSFSKYLLILLLFSCSEKEEITLTQFSVSGQISNSFGLGIESTKIYYNLTDYVLTDSQGFYTINNLSGENTINPIHTQFNFSPLSAQVSTDSDTINFIGTRIPTETEQQLFNWFNNQQLPNGLLESVENGNIVSLYDNALAAMVFMLEGDITKAEHIFDFFNARISSELTNGVGGFSQFRDRNGVANNHRWMGDNAWLLIAINNYKVLTGNTTYNQLASEISNWLIGLQDTDGGLFAGYRANNTLLNYKVTEGIIDAFNAIEEYTTFHENLLNYLEINRWDSTDKNLVAWPENPPYLYALDLHPWSYSIFPNYPVSSLSTANRYLNTQTVSNTGNLITGYCFDVDNDTVWLEGTGQMALAFNLADMPDEADFYLNEMEKSLSSSPSFNNAIGFPYASNIGTSYGVDELWEGADTNIAISGGAWYLFAKYKFNPFAIERNKNIPHADMFWQN